VGVGAVVAFAVFFLMYRDAYTKTYTFTCKPWEPPIGGARCEDCNKDPFRPCSEYRCKALGQACQLLNAGTDKATCAWVGRNDVTSPTITPASDELEPKNAGLKYISDTSIRPPALGVKIVREGASDGCLQAFTALKFGINTSEPAQCKVDYNHTSKSEQMGYYFGDMLYSYEHVLEMKLPGPDIGTNELGAPMFKNDGSTRLYVRCKDANGNENADEYQISFCVEKSPDTTPPRIESTSIPSGSFVWAGADNVPIEVYVNEPAECRWSVTSRAFGDMENVMECASDATEINTLMTYTCSGNLTGVKNMQDNKFYFRCKDKPGSAENERNVMVQSYELVLKGSQPLNIVKALPNETITGGTDVVNVNLEIETDDGAEEGKANCLFSTTGVNDSFVLMLETNDYKHKQVVSIPAGTYTYYFRCIDSGGNTAQADSTFSVLTDKTPPVVTRVYKEGETLKAVTNEDAECAYSLTSCNYNFNEGIKMVYTNPSIKKLSYAEWKANQVYYIKCKDMFGNEPSPNECGIIARAMGSSVAEK
jgi:hypothetical protein